MALYSALDDGDFREVRDVYALGFESWRHMNGGANNTSYLLEGTTNRYVLTVLDEGDYVSQTELGNLLVHLRRYGVPTAAPVRSARGRLVESVNGHRLMIKEFVDGHCHKHMPFDKLADSGAALGRVHKVSAPSWLRAGQRRLTATAVENARGADPEFIAWAKNVIEKSRVVFDIHAPSGLNHGDYFPDNVVVRPNGSLTILDWATASKDLFLIDIGFALVGMAKLDNVFHPDRADEFIRGYTSERPLVDMERRHLRESVLHASAVLGVHRFSLSQTFANAASTPPRYGRMMAFAMTVPSAWELSAQSA